MNNDLQKLPQYQCHKKVRASKIIAVERKQDANSADVPAYLVVEEEGIGPVGVDAEFMRKHNPLAGMYLVVYEDGYMSISPSMAFEAGYVRI